MCTATLRPPTLVDRIVRCANIIAIDNGRVGVMAAAKNLASRVSSIGGCGMKPGSQDFLEQLHSAFPAEPIRGDTAFSQWGGSYPDAAPYKHAVDGKTWEQLDRAYIVRRNDSL